MMALLPLIQKLILDYMTKKTHAGFSFNFTGLGFMALSSLLGTLVLFFLLLGLQTYISEIYGEPLSWLATAGVTLVLALAAYLCAQASIKKKALLHKIKEEVDESLTPMAQIIQQLAEPVKDHPLAAVILAGLAGVMAGDKLHQDKGTDQ